MEAFITPDRRGLVRALAPAFVPEIETASPEQWEALERTFEHAVGLRSLEVRRQLGLFLKLLALLGWLRYGRSLTRTSVPTRTRFLDRLSRSPVLMVRRGVWGLRTLIMMGWYTQHGVIQSIGYRASREGWSAR